MDEHGGGLDNLNDLDVAWGFDLHALLQERLQEAPAAGDAGDETLHTIDLSQAGAVDASSVPAGRAETVETVNSSQEGAVDASSVPAGRAESDSGELEAFSTDQENVEDPPVGQSERKTHGVSRQAHRGVFAVSSTVRGRTRGKNQSGRSLGVYWRAHPGRRRTRWP